jgi:hypothetical protein
MTPANPTVQNHVDSVVNDVLREYRTNTKGTSLAYIRLARKFAAVPGISKTKALELVSKNFPDEHKAFIEAQNRGEKMPVLFPKEGPSYEQRRALAIARGGRIG